MEKTFVSIILPTYNRANKIKKAINSVRNQTYPFFELIIVDDGSEDETERIVNEIDDDRIRYFKLEENGGQSRARNFGIQKARYEYIAFEDSDDCWRKKKLELQMHQMLNEKNIDFNYHKMCYSISDIGNVIMPNEKLENEKKSGYIYAQLLRENLIGMPTLLVRKECIDQCGMLDEEMKCLEDYDFVLRLAQKYRAGFVDEILLDAQYSITGVSGNAYNYLLASCQLLLKYKADYIETGNLNYRLEKIIEDAEKLGIKEKIVSILEKILSVR